MASRLEVIIGGDATKLTKATKKAESSLGSLGKSAKNISGGLKAAVGALAAAVSIDMIKEAAKAAADDAKSVTLLTKALKNSVGATKEQDAAVEDQIAKWELMSNVADEKIRPAFATLLRGTKSIKKSTDLMSLALDVSAGTGKDVETVALALNKAYGGNTGALKKLGINLKKGSDFTKELKKQFGGMAEEQAKNDPFASMDIALGNIQETLGYFVLPLFQQLADWLKTNLPNIQKFLQDAWDSKPMKKVRDALKSVWEDALVPLFAEISNKDNQDAFGSLIDTFGEFATAVANFAKSDAGKALGKFVSGTVLAALNTLDGLLSTISATLEAITNLSQGKPATKGTKANQAFADAMNPFRAGVGKGTSLTSGMSTVGSNNKTNITINMAAPSIDPERWIKSVNTYLRKNGKGQLQFVR